MPFFSFKQLVLLIGFAGEVFIVEPVSEAVGRIGMWELANVRMWVLSCKDMGFLLRNRGIW